ncbi:RidA family protein [Novosphingobium sp. 11B]
MSPRLDPAANAPLLERHVHHLAHVNATLPFSSAVSVGGLTLLSGEIGIDDDGQVPVEFDRQADRLFANLDRSLSRLCLPRSAIVKCTVMLQDISDWPKFNTIYMHFFDGVPLPARSAFGGATLAHGARVELECIAVSLCAQGRCATCNGAVSQRR